MAATDFVQESAAQDLATAVNNSLGVAATQRGDLATLVTTAKNSLVSAINELSGQGVQINDAAPSLTTAYSGTKIDTDIAAAVANIVDTAPGTLDTLNELAAALGDDPNFAATLTADVANRVRYDAAQTLTAAQQTQVQETIGIVPSVVDLAALITN